MLLVIQELCITILPLLNGFIYGEKRKMVAVRMGLPCAKFLMVLMIFITKLYGTVKAI